MHNMSLDLGQCLIPKVIGISIRAYKFLWRIDRCSMRFISRLISHGSNFLFDDFFFSVTRFTFTDVQKCSTSLRYVINIACTAKWSLHEKNTWEISNDVILASQLVLPIVIFCVFFVPIERCPVPRSHDGMFTLFLSKFCIREKANNTSDILFHVSSVDSMSL